MSGHNHDVPPPGARVRMRLMECDHGEPFVCVSDLVLWLDRMEFSRIDKRKDDFRHHLVDQLTQMAFDYMLNEDGLT